MIADSKYDDTVKIEVKLINAEFIKFETKFTLNNKYDRYVTN